MDFSQMRISFLIVFLPGLIGAVYVALTDKDTLSRYLVFGFTTCYLIVLISLLLTKSL